MEQFCLYPNDFMENEPATLACPDFAGFLLRLRRHYPELFAVPNLRQRLDLYHIEYALRAYLGWRERDGAGHTGLAVQPAAKVLNFILPSGVRVLAG
jgi:hypothetical protein